ncbi:hypothetical protein HHI36_024082 [Cryptolaemus montrouzieri]|uniref:Uncharacterized protein n=1 Tax=Cryptolaemus montrouzieri TaxID=559131 RepID=A0ABD2NP21_9CUCU
MDVIDEYEIEQMNTIINDKSSEMGAFKKTLLVKRLAQLTFPTIMKPLGCSCDTDGCNHYKMGSNSYQTELCAKNSTRLNTSTIFQDAEDYVPSSTYVTGNDDRSRLI